MIAQGKAPALATATATRCAARPDTSCATHAGGGAVSKEDGLCVEGRDIADRATGRPLRPRSPVAGVVRAPSPSPPVAVAPAIAPASAPVVVRAVLVEPPRDAPQPAPPQPAPNPSANEFEGLLRLLEEVGRNASARAQVEGMSFDVINSEAVQAAVLRLVFPRIDALSAEACALTLRWLEPIGLRLQECLALHGDPADKHAHKAPEPPPA
jgi:hypothetical protein